jgi:hypothetical protein
MTKDYFCIAENNQYHRGIRLQIEHSSMYTTFIPMAY